MRAQCTQSGFTLVEMIMVMVITGIIAAVVAVFLRAPVDQYESVARRAELTDAADTALRRIGRELRSALPNSVRITGCCTVEFIPTIGGGRYRESGGDPLAFDTADTTFDVVGPMPAAAATNHIVVYNLGISGADAYEGSSSAAHVRRPINGVGASNLTITSANALPFESPGRRFHVVAPPVQYQCTGTNLVRVSNYGWPESPLASNTTELLASGLSGCGFTYDGNVVTQRSGLVTMRLDLTSDGETVSLYHAIHVNNQP